MELTIKAYLKGDVEGHAAFRCSTLGDSFRSVRIRRDTRWYVPIDFIRAIPDVIKDDIDYIYLEQPVAFGKSSQGAVYKYKFGTAIAELAKIDHDPKLIIKGSVLDDVQQLYRSLMTASIEPFFKVGEIEPYGGPFP